MSDPLGCLDERQSTRLALAGPLLQDPRQKAFPSGCGMKSFVLLLLLVGLSRSWPQAHRKSAQHPPNSRPVLAVRGPTEKATIEVMAVSDQSTEKKETGKLLRWIEDKGFGFIRPDAGGEDLFCHVRNLVDGPLSIKPGEEVKFSKRYNEIKEKWEAIEVRSKNAVGEIEKVLPHRSGPRFDGFQFEAGALSEFVTTNQGLQMPRMIYKLSGVEKNRSEGLVKKAVKKGFRGVDVLGDKEEVGAGLARLFAKGFTRESLFIQTKIGPRDYAVERQRLDEPITGHVELLIERALSNLGLDYVDSLVLNAPYEDHAKTMEAWRAMENAVSLGKVRQLGISLSASPAICMQQLRPLYEDAVVKPSTVERWNLVGREFRMWCKEHHIYIQTFWMEAGITNFWGLGFDEHPDIRTKMTALQEKYGVSLAVLTWRAFMGVGIVPLVFAAEREDFKKDAAAFRVPLTEEDAHEIDEMYWQSGVIIQPSFRWTSKVAKEVEYSI